MKILDLFTKRFADLDRKIQHQNMRLKSSHMAVESGVNILIRASNALHLVAEGKNAKTHK